MKAAYTGWTWITNREPEAAKNQLKQAFQECKFLGYDTVENFAFIRDYYADDPQALVDLTKECGVDLVNLYGHFTFDVEEAIRIAKEQIDFCAAVGVKWYNCQNAGFGDDGPSERPTNPEMLDKMCYVANTVGAYAKEKGVAIMGDIPIYVAADSADAWAGRELFETDAEGKPRRVAGCPPDYFAADGQLWGNPLYDWDYHRRTGYAWWILRIRHALSIYDILRIDHFRGFDTYWAIPAGETTARNGRWEQGPRMELFRALHNALGSLPIVAEDLGEMFDSVRELLAESGFPGMKVLQFAFTGEDSVDLPHNYPRNCVAYPGTHDNNTLTGWFAEELTAAQRKQVVDYFALTKQEGTVRGMLRGVLASTAALAIIPMADWLEEPVAARMNTPGQAKGNWQWRADAKKLTPALAAEIRVLTERYFRAAK